MYIRISAMIYRWGGIIDSTLMYTRQKEEKEDQEGVTKQGDLIYLRCNLGTGSTLRHGVHVENAILYWQDE